MWLSRATNSVYFGDKEQWDDIQLISERPSVYHVPVISEGVHTGEWEEDVELKPVKTEFSSLDYFDRFTAAEQQAIVAATVTDMQVKLYYDLMLAADVIDINDPRTIAGLDVMIAAELLDASRKPELLAPE